MKVITNSDNSAALKILIAGEYAEMNLELVITDKPASDGLKRLPILEISPGDVLFSTNAAAYLLFPPPKNSEPSVDNWLDWEAMQLQPCVTRCVDAKGSLNEPLPQLLTLLENGLKKYKYLVKDTMTVADISIWSTLFPLFTDEKLKSQLMATEKLSEWFHTLEKLPKFQAGLKKLKPAGGMVSLQSLSSTTWYPSSQQALASVTDSPSKEPALKDSELSEAKQFWSVDASKRPKVKQPTVPVLPKPGERNVLITSALPYVNNVPHLGNIIGCVLSADVFARYSRLRGWNTLYISGTDEYGTATETKALEEGLTPRQICDKYFTIHRDIYQWFNIQFDLFGRTTTPQQTEVVQELFLLCHKNGYTCTQTMDQLLCEKCDRYLADRFVEGTCPKCGYEDARGDQCDKCGQLINAPELIKPRCKVCGNTPVLRQAQQLFLDLPKIAPRLQKWVDSTSSGWTANAEMITKSWLKDGLKPRCITRDLKWGIPVPLAGFEQKVFYVWFDAPIGYMSITKCYTDQWRTWWQPGPNAKVELFQFMAKDNVPFHAIMFPATLMSVDKGHTIVSHVCATEYLNYEDGKFSKSRGVGVFGTDAKETGIPADTFRFYLLYVRPEGQDSSFSWLDLATKNNSELLNNLGNFVNRALVFCEKFFASQVPEMVMTDEEWNLLAQVSREVKAYNLAMERTRFREGMVRIMNIARLGNQYMQVCEPWQAIKGSDDDKARAKTCVGVSCNIATLLAMLIKPYMPHTSDVMAAQINAPKDAFILTDHVYQILTPGHRIGKPVPLFAKIEPSTVDQLKKRFAGRQQSPPAAKGVKPTLDPAIDSLDKMEAAVQKQADLVRSMKEGGAAKSEWQPHVKVLLEMKKQLEGMKKATPQVQNQTSSPSSSRTVEVLEKEVTEQGEKVRVMKQGGKSKQEWQPEVDKLLKLKKELAALKGEPDPTVKQKSKK
ncbi:methionine--tRNA ligase, cytoplasmic-like [Macrosteles quadrilineatus]|uniref:methionine--tRNA ligase, cytoplasmic-like n=1 Tax=Macrosteles quadrilineatus TaxID=74068 RepID=UPI0023E1184A|nr:methionine--tRNA ligase, cytoplasmic-like [Macrosteles quadrilineatus]